MKKILIYTVVLVVSLFFTVSCEKEEIGGTATEEMAGEWYVTVVAVDADGNVVFEDDDLFGIGNFHLDTYNTSSNSPTEMWVDDHGNFWDFKVKAIADLGTKNFQGTDLQNEYYDVLVNISDGEIIYDAATTPGGMPADSIMFNVTFGDDTYPEDFGFDTYRVAGYRYTGLTNDD